MHILLIFSVIFCLSVPTNGKPWRPINEPNRDAGEAEYESNEESTADDYPQDDQEVSIDSQEVPANNGRREVLQENAHLPYLGNNPYKPRAHSPQSVQLDNFDNFSDVSGANRGVRNDKTTRTNIDSDARPIPRYRQSDGYVENNEQEVRQGFNGNNFKINSAQSLGDDNTINKRAMLSVSANEEGDLLFENNRDQANRVDKSEFARDAGVATMQSRYFKQLYNAPAENREFPDYKRYEKLRLNIDRERRQAQTSNLKETDDSTPSSEDSKEQDTMNENEESAIKRHVKKLSGEELEELLNTLSEDKRNLLKKIMENELDNDNEPINKREITKKAGAVEENNYIENGQLDSIKIQGVSSNVDDVNTETSMSRETTETNKRTMSATEIGDVMPSKNTGGCEKPESKPELSNQNEDVKEVKSENSQDLNSNKADDVELESPSQTMVKTEIKREINATDVINIGKSTDDSQIMDNDYNLKEFQDSVKNHKMLTHDKELTELLNEEAEPHNSNKNNFKREFSMGESDFSDSINTLEESFPNTNAKDEFYPFSGSDMAPLIRVKRKDANSAMKKRAANVIADSNVPYFPNKGENDDEDNDEGSEFDEDGFYDRTSNYARSNDNSKPHDPQSKASDRFSKQKSAYNYGNVNLETDTMNLGSDTDNIMTGEEGVNDNLMYNSELRNRRTSEDNDHIKISSADKDVTFERRLRSTPLPDSEEKTASETYINIQGYQENDAFGPLQGNYEGDLGRYKRIRRVKQSPVLQKNASPNESV